MKPLWFKAAMVSNPGLLLRLGAIGAVMLSVTGAFAYTGGWLSPGRLTPDRMMAAFRDANGTHAGFRRNHAKGVCVAGWFEGSGQAAAISKAAVFKPGRVPVIGRFALAGGMPFQPDAPNTVRSMALSFRPPGGEEWRTGMNNIPVFPVNSARGFYEQLLAFSPDPATGKPDPAKIKTFLTAHPEAARALALIKKRAGHFRFRKLHLQWPQCLPLRRRGRRLCPGSLVRGAGATRRGRANGSDRRELSL